MFFAKLVSRSIDIYKKFPIALVKLNLTTDKLSKHIHIRKMRIEFDPAIKGSTVLNRDLFKIQLKVPAIKIQKNDILQVRRILKNYSFDSVVSPKRFTNLPADDPLFESHKYIFLDPDTFSFDNLDTKVKEDLQTLFKSDASKSGIDNPIEEMTLNLEYSDFKFEDVVKAIIPDELLKENVNIKGYSVIGHIAHFNLREKILDYKQIIGQVLLDKINNIKTVVNKVSGIDNTYRNFELEILAGVNDTMVQCKENQCFFKFDFAKVYWNPRLSTEHERVVNTFETNDVLYDVFAGVGPFSIPAVSNKKLEAVLANDLNPNSYRYLLENYKTNNRSKTKLKHQELRKAFIRQHPPEAPVLESLFNFSPSQDFLAFNLDGRLFIQQKVKYHFIGMLNYLLKYKPDNVKSMKFHVLMNLPAMSVEFLDAFKGLYDKEESDRIRSHFDKETLANVGLNVNCYHFSKTSENELEKIQERIKKEIMQDESLTVVSKHVRNVAPNKEMHVTMYKVHFKHLLTSEETIQNAESEKKNKLASEDDSEENHPAKMAKYENSGFY